MFFGCANYPDCDFTLWNRPVPSRARECGAPFLVEKITKRHGRQLICNNEECDYVRSRSWRRRNARDAETQRRQTCSSDVDDRIR